MRCLWLIGLLSVLGLVQGQISGSLSPGNNFIAFKGKQTIKIYDLVIDLEKFEELVITGIPGDDELVFTLQSDIDLIQESTRVGQERQILVSVNRQKLAGYCFDPEICVLELIVAKRNYQVIKESQLSIYVQYIISNTQCPQNQLLVSGSKVACDSWSNTKQVPSVAHFYATLGKGKRGFFTFQNSQYTNALVKYSLLRSSQDKFNPSLTIDDLSELKSQSPNKQVLDQQKLTTEMFDCFLDQDCTVMISVYQYVQRVNEKDEYLDQFKVEYLEDREWTQLQSGILRKTQESQQQTLATYFVDWKLQKTASGQFVLEDRYLNDREKSQPKYSTFFQVCLFDLYLNKRCTGMTSIQVVFDKNELEDVSLISISLLQNAMSLIWSGSFSEVLTNLSQQNNILNITKPLYKVFQLPNENERIALKTDPERISQYRSVVCKVNATECPFYQGPLSNITGSETLISSNLRSDEVYYVYLVPKIQNQILIQSFETYFKLLPASNKSLSGGAIAGIVIGCVLGALLIAGGAWWYIKKRKSSGRTDLESNASESLVK